MQVQDEEGEDARSRRRDALWRGAPVAAVSACPLTLPLTCTSAATATASACGSGPVSSAPMAREETARATAERSRGAMVRTCECK